MNKRKLAKGIITYACGLESLNYKVTEQEKLIKSILEIIPDGLDININEYMDNMLKSLCGYEEYHIIDGKDFLEEVKSNCLTTYDGYISEVLVDGYITNLGLAYNSFESGKFLLAEDIWLDMCKDHDIKVNWVNK